MKNRVPEDPDIGDKKGSQPKKYHSGLSKSTKEKRDAHFKRGAKMDDDNPAAYTPAPGDKEAKTKPSVHTQKFKKMYGEEVTQKQIQDLEKFADRLLQKFNIDIEFTRHFADRMNDPRNVPEIKISELQKLFKKISRQKGKDIRQNPDTEAVLKDIQSDLNLPVVINYDKNKDEFEVINKTIMRKKDFKTPNKVIRYEEIQIDESSEEGLKNKAEKSGVSVGILRQVYKRGVAAWRTGHRPGTTPQQWGMARVNSFLTGGKTRTTADADLWKKAKTQKEELSCNKYTNKISVQENSTMNIFSKYLVEAKADKATIAKLKKMGGEEAEMAAFLLDQGDMKELNKFMKSLSPSDRKKIQSVMEEVNITESKFDIYHKDFSSAVQHARKQAEKRGYTIDDDEWFRTVSSGPRKPGTGKTNSYSIELLDKNGKPTKKKLSMQVYNTGKSYELNMYTEELQIEQNDTSEKVEMAQTQLHFIGYACDEILEFIRMGGEIEEWYQNKLSKVHSDMEGLHSYIEGEMRRTGMKEEVSAKDEKQFHNKLDNLVHKYFGDSPDEEKMKKKVKKEEVDLDEEKNITVSFHSAAAKRKWLKKQGISPKEIIKQSLNQVELPASMKQYAQKKDHDEIYSVTEAKFSVDIEGLPRFYMDSDSPSKVKTALRTILKKPAMIKDVERAPESKVKADFRNRASGKEQVDEAKIAPDMIKKLRAEYGKIQKIDPSSETYKKLKAFITGMDKDQLQAIADANIKWLSMMAQFELKKK